MRVSVAKLSAKPWQQWVRSKRSDASARAKKKRLGFVIKGVSDMASCDVESFANASNRERDEVNNKKSLNWKSDTLKIHGNIREIYASATHTNRKSWACYTYVLCGYWLGTVHLVGCTVLMANYSRLTSAIVRTRHTARSTCTELNHLDTTTQPETSKPFTIYLLHNSDMTLVYQMSGLGVISIGRYALSMGHQTLP